MVESQKKVLAANYAFSFYNNLELLENAYAQYAFKLLELEKKGASSEEQNLEVSDAERAMLKEFINQINVYSTKCYLRAFNIINNLKIEKKEIVLAELKKIYNSLRANHVIKIKDAEAYVMFLHDLLVKDVIRELLVNSQDIINKIYE